MKRPELHDLVIEYLEEAGFNTNSWQHSESVDIDGIDNNWTHRYVIIPGLFRMFIIEKKPYGSHIKLKGIPGFEALAFIEDPECLDTIRRKLRDSYIWMKNINSECTKDLLNESQGFCSGTNF